MLFTKKMTRFSAFGIHFGTSLAIFLALFAIVVLAWYPWPLFDIEGGWKGIRIVAMVDIVLGPLLTLIIFKPGKPGLKFDLSVIVVCQLAALAWGVMTLYEARPIYLVFADDRLTPVSHSLMEELDPDGSTRQRLDATGTTHFAVSLPKDPIEFADFVARKDVAKRSLAMLFERYQPLEASWPDVVDDSLDIEHYVKKSADAQRVVMDFLASYDQTIEQLVFLPIVGRYKRDILVADRENREFITLLDIPYDPAHARKRLSVSQRIKNLAP